ncbi:30S ribosomal protein S5 [Mycoplasmoides alvi]|uniref:30S ribosomal protein S5 n=1 Tax=Mycoplasmoides alvi TaxID=78580 RepID=UPI00055D5891|nr:30S ribosomal protein S5 [Mycoplasmoides alvi]
MNSIEKETNKEEAVAIASNPSKTNKTNAAKKNNDERNKRKVERKSKSEYEERIVKISRISKTTKGGRNMRFSALVVIGNRRGKVGFGLAKALEVPNAIKKALRAAEKNVHDVFINKHGTIFHEVVGRFGAAKVLLKPAPSGTGIIAGGPIRAIIELAGYTDIYTKNLGKNTPVNMISATLNGITNQLTPKEVARLRGKELRDL